MHKVCNLDEVLAPQLPYAIKCHLSIDDNGSIVQKFAENLAKCLKLWHSLAFCSGLFSLFHHILLILFDFFLVMIHCIS